MRRALPILTTAAPLVGACSDGSDDTSDSSVASPEIVATKSAASVPATKAPATIAAETTTSAAPTTTIDEAALLAEAEAAYLEAFEVALVTLRNPDDPDNQDELRDKFVGGNLDKALENLRLTVEGNLIAKENPDNPSLMRVVEGGEFLGAQRTTVELTVYEFNSDRIYERGTAPGGGDSLVKHNPRRRCSL